MPRKALRLTRSGQGGDASMEYIPSNASVLRLAAKNKAFTDSEKVYPRNFAEEPVDLEKVETPAELKPTDRAVSEYILRTLRADPKHRFNSASIGKNIHLSGITVKRSLKRLQRLGYLRLKRLNTGYINYLWYPERNGGSMTSFDASESLLRAFPELEQRVAPLGTKEAIEKARELGFQINEARALWKEFKEVCADVCLYSGDETWNKWLKCHLRIKSAGKVLERLAA